MKAICPLCFYDVKLNRRGQFHRHRERWCKTDDEGRPKICAASALTLLEISASAEQNPTPASADAPASQQPKEK